MADFLQKLRMNNVFSPPGGGTPFGMPDLHSGPDINAMMQNMQNSVISENDKDRQLERELAQLRMKPPALPAIAAAATTKPMNTVFAPGINEYQRGQLAGRAADRDSRELIASGRLGLGREQIAGRADLQDMRGGQVIDQINQRGNITSDQINQRGNITSDQIEQRGQITDRQINRRGEITSGHIGERGDIQKDIQGMRGQQGLNNIAARGIQSRIGDDSLSPGETKTTQDLAIRNLKMTDPELGPLVTIGTGGNIEISPEATPEQREMINGKVFARTSDIRLPSSTPRYNNSSVATSKKKKYKAVTIE